jgi:hypothetical protein
MIEKDSFNDEVLDRVANDYEAPHTIVADLARDLGREVTEQEVLQALLALAISARVQAFVHDTTKHDYVSLAVDDVASHKSLWFKAKKQQM